MNKKNIVVILLSTFSIFCFGQDIYKTKSGKKYHTNDCRYTNENSIKLSIEEAISQGLEPCKVCKPENGVSGGEVEASEKRSTSNVGSHGYFQEGLSDKTLIASWNILRLGQNEKNYIAAAEIAANFDVIALQEVMNESGMIRLENSLEEVTGREWSYIISERSVGTESYREYYGFIYNEEVEVVEINGFYPESGNEFIREPYAVTFEVSGFDFTMVSIHVIWGEPAERKAEAGMIDDVYAYFQGLDEVENDVIIVGDFNMPASSRAFDIDENYGVVGAIDTSLKTTIGRKKMHSSSYDQIFYNPVETDEIAVSGGVFSFVQEEDFQELRKTISDHMPVYVEVLQEGGEEVDKKSLVD